MKMERITMPGSTDSGLYRSGRSEREREREGGARIERRKGKGAKDQTFVGTLPANILRYHPHTHPPLTLPPPHIH